MQESNTFITAVNFGKILAVITIIICTEESPPAGNHQIVAEDLVEDRTISRIINAYSLRQGRRLPTTMEVKELQFVSVM
jgi:hypothetical protein